MSAQEPFSGVERFAAAFKELGDALTGVLNRCAKAMEELHDSFTAEDEA